ncbi:hypothetical protein I4U23_017170 [Adineta vaga]|nr:hypothetical protein I4U23_017170 [Adineta vaga]
MDDIFQTAHSDCIDGSDEIETFWDMDEGIPALERDNLICKYNSKFNCGDGECIDMHFPSTISDCNNKRDYMFNYLLDWHNPNDRQYPYCFKLLVCASADFYAVLYAKYCQNLCNDKQECRNRTLQKCGSIFLAPSFPVWDNHVRLGYFSNQTVASRVSFEPQIVCYNASLCPFLISTLIVDNYTCIPIKKLNLTHSTYVYRIFERCRRSHWINNEDSCSESTIKCPNVNKCIPKRKILDGVIDCPDEFDESTLVNSCDLNDKYRFKCTSEKKCIRSILVGDGKKHCLNGEDEQAHDETTDNIYHIPFSYICDSWIHFNSSITNDTDESDCNQWQCINQYTHCNGIWNCPKGIDELNCSSIFSCPFNHHPCLSPNTSKMECLNINYIDDGIMDCLGGTDERSFCKFQNSKHLLFKSYHCWNDTKCVNVFDRCTRCKQFDHIDQLCWEDSDETDNIIKYLESMDPIYYYKTSSFSHLSSEIYPSKEFFSISSNVTNHAEIENIEYNLNSDQYIPHIQICSRGILILIGENQTQHCLCPSNYYGDFCQYQNQRVSLTIRIKQEDLDQSHITGLIIRLVDNTGFIHSLEQITYIPSRDCNMKYNLFLLYHNGSKDMKKNYTIYIDAYDKINLLYRKSWLYSIKFLFLPINRLSIQLIIPLKQDCQIICSSIYLPILKNDQIYKSCLCHSNVISSSIKEKCNCSKDSICVGFIHNQSLCLCSTNKIGRQCYLNSSCQTNRCENNAFCIPDDYRISMNNYICVCSKGFSGQYCQENNVKISISFSNIDIPSSFLIHFIRIFTPHVLSWNELLTHITLFEKVLFDQEVVDIYMSKPFHLVFGQVKRKFYLIVLQHIYQSSINISTQISSSQYCPHINELFNQTILNYSIMRRVKFYHLPCQEHSNLMCFHDNEIFMCLCTKQRHANCFHYNFTKDYQCFGENPCHNGGECFQDDSQCPTKRLCLSMKKEQKTLQKQIEEEFDRHKHLILTLILLIILAVPRLIISFLPNCMKSPKEYPIFLTGYFLARNDRQESDPSPINSTQSPSSYLSFQASYLQSSAPFGSQTIPSSSFHSSKIPACSTLPSPIFQSIPPSPFRSPEIPILVPQPSSTVW